MTLRWRVSCVFEVVGAFLGRERFERLGDGGVERLRIARSNLAQQVLELGEDLLDRSGSGEYLGRNRRLAPAERMSWRTALPLWLPRLSIITISSGFRHGTRTFST